MPQMSPLNWLTLLLYFNLLIWLTIFMWNFHFKPTPHKILNSSHSSYLFWKW